MEDLAQVRGFYSDDKHLGTFETVASLITYHSRVQALKIGSLILALLVLAVACGRGSPEAARSASATPSSSAGALEAPRGARLSPDAGTSKPDTSSAAIATATGAAGDPELRPSSVVVTGGAVANANAVVAGMTAGFKRCYGKALHETGSVTGTIRVTVELDATGAVKSTERVVTGNVSSALANCVIARAGSADFGAPDRLPSTVTFLMTFDSKKP